MRGFEFGLMMPQCQSMSRMEYKNDGIEWADEVVNGPMEVPERMVPRRVSLMTGVARILVDEDNGDLMGKSVVKVGISRITGITCRTTRQRFGCTLIFYRATLKICLLFVLNEFYCNLLSNRDDVGR
jgi:hypothetical protein